jgi:uncharacterized protein YggE
VGGGPGEQNERVPKRGTVSVVGHGRAEGTPDVCRVRLGVTALRPGVAAALGDSEQAARQVRESLASNGVAPRDAATGSVTIQAEEDYSGQRGPRLLGYRAEHTLTVVLRDLAAAGRVLGDAVGAGGDAVRLQGVDFAVEDDSALRAAAREAAWLDAQRAAAQLAELAGRALGAVRSIDAGGGGGMPRPMPRGRGMMTMAAAPEVGLEPGGVAVEVALAVVWELA